MILQDIACFFELENSIGARKIEDPKTDKNISFFLISSKSFITSGDSVRFQVRGASNLIQWMPLQDVKFYNSKSLKCIKDKIEFDAKTSLE